MSSMPQMKLEHGAKVSIIDWPKDLEALHAVAKKDFGICDDPITVKAGRRPITSEDAFQAYSATVANTEAMVIVAITIETDNTARPVAANSGLCWQDLFLEEGLPSVGWPSIAAVAKFVKYGKATLSGDLRYKIEPTGKGRIHLTVSDDEDGLSANEVLQQDPGLLVGG